MDTRPASADVAKPRARPALGDVFLGRYFRAVLVVSAALAAAYLCYRLTVPFLTPLTVALVLAVLFAPFHRWVSTLVKVPNLAALVSVLTIAGLVLAGLTLLVAQLVQEIVAGADMVRAALDDGLLQKLLSAHPKVAHVFQAALDRFNAAGLMTDAASWVTNLSASMLRGSVVQVVGALLTFYLLFYLLRDQDEALLAVHSLLPFAESETKLILTRAVDAVHATVYGTLVTGAILGFVGGVIFAVLGLTAPILWGAIMAVFAILPVLGMGMIWIPAALLLALDGEWARAVILILAFTSLSAANSLIYPLLVGNRMKLHTALAFIAALGGLIVLGPVGFILGPLVVAVTLAFKDVLRARLDAPHTPLRTS